MSKRHTNRDMDKLAEESGFLKLKQRAKRHEVKTTKATEALVGDLHEQNKKLSQQVLVLRRLLKAMSRLLPPSLKLEYERLQSDIESLADIEVHLLQ